MDFRMYFMLFIVYSLIGWIVEVVGILIQEKKLVNRGFLIGPYCPIYGVGGITIILLLNKYMEDSMVMVKGWADQMLGSSQTWDCLNQYFWKLLA